MNQEERLSNQYRYFKSLLTQMSSALTNYEQEPEPGRLFKLLDRLKVRHNTLDNMYCDVAPADEAEEKKRMDIDERYFDAVIAVEKFLKQSHRDNENQQTTPTSFMGDSIGVKLPKIELLRCDSKVKEWLSFKDRFRHSLILKSYTTCNPLCPKTPRPS